MVPEILVFLGLTLVAGAIVGVVLYPRLFPIVKRWQRISVGLLGGLSLVVGIVLYVVSDDEGVVKAMPPDEPVLLGQPAKVEIEGPAGAPCRLIIELPDGTTLVVDAGRISEGSTLVLEYTPNAEGGYTYKVRCESEGDAFFDSGEFEVTA